MQELISKDIEELKNKHTETNNTITEIENILEGIKKKKEFTLKPGKRRFKHNKFSKIIMKRQRNTAQIKEQTRNTEVQINEEEIAKYLKKNSE